MDSASVSVLKQWAFEIVSALKYLDDHGIIHASLSPTNILLDKEVSEKASRLICNIYSLTIDLESHSTVWLWTSLYDRWRQIC